MTADRLDEQNAGKQGPCPHCEKESQMLREQGVMSSRDSRAEARKIRRALFRLLEPSPNQRKQAKWVEEILLGLARREYEAGYRDGMQERVNAQAAEEGRNARRRG